MSKARILIVEDDALTMQFLETALRAAGYEVAGAATSMAAIQATQLATPDLMILDLSLVDDYPFHSIRDGFGVLGWLRRTLPDANFPVIIHTVNDSPAVAICAQAHGVYGVFRKGGDVQVLLESVRRALIEVKAA